MKEEEKDIHYMLRNSAFSILLGFLFLFALFSYFAMGLTLV